MTSQLPSIVPRSAAVSTIPDRSPRCQSRVYRLKIKKNTPTHCTVLSLNSTLSKESQKVIERVQTERWTIELRTADLDQYSFAWKVRVQRYYNCRGFLMHKYTPYTFLSRSPSPYIYILMRERAACDVWMSCYIRSQSANLVFLCIGREKRDSRRRAHLLALSPRIDFGAQVVRSIDELFLSPTHHRYISVHAYRAMFTTTAEKTTTTRLGSVLI